MALSVLSGCAKVRHRGLQEFTLVTILPRSSSSKRSETRRLPRSWRLSATSTSLSRRLHLYKATNRQRRRYRPSLSRPSSVATSYRRMLRTRNSVCSLSASCSKIPTGFLGLRALKHMAKDVIHPSQSATKVAESYRETLKKLKDLTLNGSTIRTDINVLEVQKTLNRVTSAVDDIGEVPYVFHANQL
jgi:hypothetical protein